MAIKHKIRVEDKHIIVKDMTARKACKMFCCECMGWQPKMVRGCEVDDCPLWPFRTNDTPRSTV